MGSPQLENLVRIRQLKEEAPARAEIDGLIRSGNVRLKDAQLQNLSLDSRFDLAYNAAHAFSLAALRWHGYRSESRFTVFQCLEHTINWQAARWRVLDAAHQKRNLAEYEGMLDVEESAIAELWPLTAELLDDGDKLA